MAQTRPALVAAVESSLEMARLSQDALEAMQRLIVKASGDRCRVCGNPGSSDAPLCIECYGWALQVPVWHHGRKSPLSRVHRPAPVSPLFPSF